MIHAEWSSFVTVANRGESVAGEVDIVVATDTFSAARAERHLQFPDEADVYAFTEPGGVSADRQFARASS